MVVVVSSVFILALFFVVVILFVVVFVFLASLTPAVIVVVLAVKVTFGLNVLQDLLYKRSKGFGFDTVCLGARLVFRLCLSGGCLFDLRLMSFLFLFIQ